MASVDAGAAESKRVIETSMTDKNRTKLRERGPLFRMNHLNATRFRSGHLQFMT